jgi:mono/diheme cytochrome c family protein
MFAFTHSRAALRIVLSSTAVRVVSLLVVIVGVACLTSNGPARADAARQTLASSAPADRGRALYARHCASCHGPTGRGDGEAGHDLDPQPSNLHDPDIAAAPATKLFRQITRGRRPMPSFGRLLSEDDRWAVVAFIKSMEESDARGGRQ